MTRSLFSGQLLIDVYMSFQDLVILNLSGKFCKLLTLFHIRPTTTMGVACLILNKNIGTPLGIFIVKK
jgi:hypothetical protein